MSEDKETIAVRCGQEKKTQQRIAKRWQRQKSAGRLDRSFELSLVPTAQEWSLVSDKETRTRTKSEAVPATSGKTITVNSPSTKYESWWEKITVEDVRRWGFDIGCLSIVFGHAGLIWYDCADLWGNPGCIGGGVVFLVVLVSVIISTDPDKNRTSNSAVAFVFVVDLFAYFVHYPVFSDSANIGRVETGALCAFLCACSWIALYLFRDSKLLW